VLFSLNPLLVFRMTALIVVKCFANEFSTLRSDAGDLRDSFGRGEVEVIVLKNYGGFS